MSDLRCGTLSDGPTVLRFSEHSQDRPPRYQPALLSILFLQGGWRAGRCLPQHRARNRVWDRAALYIVQMLRSVMDQVLEFHGFRLDSAGSIYFVRTLPLLFQHLRSVSHLTGCLSSSATKGTELRGRRPVQGMNHLSKSDNRFSCINGKTHLSRSRLGQCAESCLFRPSLTTCGGSPVASLRRCTLSDPAKDPLSMRDPLSLATRRRTPHELRRS